MRFVILIVIFFTLYHSGFSQTIQRKEWKDLVKLDSLPGHITNNKVIAPASMDSSMQEAINEANETSSLSELTGIVNSCTEYCSTSPDISALLTNWLREDHPIYNNRTPTDVNQFRAFLLASLSQFPSTEEIYKYVKSELLFADHTINIAAASVTARNFPEKSAELISLMEPFLNSSFPDEWVDIKTPKLNYPITNPTKARYEIMKTLKAFGASAYRSINLLDEMASCKGCRDYNYDSLLSEKAFKTAEYIREVTPPCCRKEAPTASEPRSIVLIGKGNRNVINNSNVKLIDQEGNSLQFKDLSNKPFVLIFFYTQCTNASKCVASVHRLGQLETACIENNLTDKIGIYGMSYDPDFDTPPILKKYGKMYGVQFRENIKFFKTVSKPATQFFDQLQLRVNYGAGTVNNHGIQLFIFDKKGQLAAVCDNNLWSISDVKKCLMDLVEE
jgi:cytochrome oxidase Cu insertion factor (SCO1/SenC/PrrC family)